MDNIKKHRKVGKAAVLPTAPAYTWAKARERPIDHLKSKTPGPGQYQPSINPTKPNTPAFSLSHKTKPEKDTTNTPGPDTYKDAAQFRVKEVHGATLKFRHEASGAEPGPGPLEYADMHFSRRPASEGKSFGTSRTTPRGDHDMPGPIYNQDISPVRRRPKSWSMPRSERDPRPDNKVPGPGTYLHAPVIDRDCGHGIRSDNRSSPAYTVQGKPYTPAQDATPGPLDYGLPKEPMRRSHPAFSFRGTHAKDYTDRPPGPGAYNHNKFDSAVRVSAPAFSLGLKQEDPGLKERRPGPQEYNIRLDSKPGVSLKFRHEQQGKDSGPGPGAYKNLCQIYCPCSTRKGFSFGVKPKAKARDDVPGPIYSIGCTTLGIAAATHMTEKQINQIAVL